MLAYKGCAELTFADRGCLLVAADRVRVTLSASGDGALRISPGTAPQMTAIVTALTSGPFILTFDDGMVQCKSRQWVVRETDDATFEMLLTFEQVYGHTRHTPKA